MSCLMGAKKDSVMSFIQNATLRLSESSIKLSKGSLMKNYVLNCIQGEADRIIFLQNQHISAKYCNVSDHFVI